MARRKKEVYSISTDDKCMALRFYRLANDLTLDDLANDPDVPVKKNAISRYERGLYRDDPVKQKAFEEMFRPFVETILK